MSHSWPDPMYRLRTTATATGHKNRPLIFINDGFTLYSLVIVVSMMN